MLTSGGKAAMVVPRSYSRKAAAIGGELSRFDDVPMKFLSP